MFVHLHVHSHYSLLDGLPKIPELVARAKADGMSALALTDHGALYGCIEFYQEARSAGIKPILGMEAYVAPHALHLKRPKIDEHAYHCTILAATNEGYRNLLELATIAQLDGFYYKPRIDMKALERFRNGLIVLSGCWFGEVATALRERRETRAREAAQKYSQVLGPGNFYIEIQRNPLVDAEKRKEQERVNGGLVTLARELDLPLVATADIHYLKPDDRDAHDALVCIGTGTTVTEEKRLDMRGIDLSFTESATMEERFSDLPDTIKNTALIAERCHVTLTLGKWHFPQFPLPPNEHPDSYLAALAEEGLHKRIARVTKEARDRLHYELDIIQKKGYAMYFLVVADFVRFTRERHIISTTRGSAAGSLVAYALGITTLNPLDYELPFERFLNPERPSPPDIDVDLEDSRRDEVIEYVTTKYGASRVARIVTFGTMLARAAVRDVSRALGLPYASGDTIAKLIPLGAQGSAMTIRKAKEMEPELLKLSREDPTVAKVLSLAEKIEGSARHASVHAAGVVIAPTKLTDFTPLQRENDRTIITQYEMGACEAVGLLKIDFLGIRNLSIIGEAIRIISATTNAHIDLDRIPMDDKATYALLAKGETMGLFQLGGSGMTRYLKELMPTTIFDIMAMISLFRPGPMESIPEYIKRKHNPRLVKYLHQTLKPILERSLGILVFQDDVLLIAVKLAGYTWAEADKLRKAMGKKIPREMQMQKAKFLSGCSGHGLDTATAEELWSLIEPFAAYGFNKAHAASYAIVAYQTAYLKAHFPSQFMAAVMTAESDNLDTIAEAVQECRKIGIQVLPPDINESRKHFTYISDHAIRFGLAAIKNLGSDMIQSSIRERERGGAFASLENFLTRLPQETYNKKSLESLIKSGALDRFGERNALLTNLERLLEFVRQRAGSDEQQTLFAASPKERKCFLSPAPPATESQTLSWERELLGLYVTAHPFAKIAESIRDVLPSLIQQIDRAAEGELIKIVGMISAKREVRTKRGELMAFVTLEDESGNVEGIVFPRTYRDVKDLMTLDTLMLVRGRLDTKSQEKKLILESAAAADTATLRSILLTTNNGIPPQSAEPPQDLSMFKKHITITLHSELPAESQSNLRTLFVRNAGDTRVFIAIPHQEKLRTIETDFRIRYDEDMKASIEQICGEGTVQK